MTRARLSVLGAAIASAFLFGPAHVEAKAQPKPSELIETYDAVDSMCGEVGSPATKAAACEERDKLSVRIKAQGWCKGRPGQAPVDYRWHECGPKSL